MNTPRRLTALLGLTLGALLAGAAPADDLGRLFTSATERARIDAARADGQPQQDAPGNVSGGERVVLNGTLRGSDGKRLVWLNGAPVNPDAAHDLTLLRDGRVQLSWRDGAKILKPGQGVDPVSGEVFDHHTPVPPRAETATPAPNPGAKPDAKPKPAVAQAETAPSAPALKPPP